ncbi:MAG: permease [Chloroflexota bacterium]
MLASEILIAFLGLAGKLVVIFLAVTLVVGLLHEYVPRQKLQAVMSRAKPPLGNILGAGLGAATPFCSCSTIPMVVGLLGAGAPFGATMSFLIASPLLNPVIIALMLSLMGTTVTLSYAAFALVAAVASGMIWQRLGFRGLVKRVRLSEDGADCDWTLHDGVGNRASWWARNRPRLGRSLGFTGGMFRQVLPYLLVGAAVGGAIHGFLPEAFVARVAGPDNRFAVPVAAVVGVPMYIRAATVIPISAALLAKGMSMGAVVALIIGGAGASIPEVTLLGAIFRRKLVIVFVVTVLVTAILAGFAFNTWFL